jgi:hypothetical protein
MFKISPGMEKEGLPRSLNLNPVPIQIKNEIAKIP